MDKNSYMGFFLIVLIMIGSYFFLKGPAVQAKKLQAQQDSIKAVQAAAKKQSPAAVKFDSAKKTLAVDTAALKATPFGAASVGSEKFTTLENKELLIKLSNKGGRVYSVELKNYKTFNKKPLILFKGDTSNSFGLNLRVADKPINTNDYYFTPNAQGLAVAEKDSSSITMRLSYSATQYIDYIYSLKGTGFKLGLTIKTTGLDNVIANSNNLNLVWSANLPKQEMDMKQERSYSEIYYKNTENEVSDFGDTKDDQKTVADKKVQWVAFKEHFFSDILVVKPGIDKSALTVATDITDTSNVKQMKAELAITRTTDGSIPMEFYFGPNQTSILKAQGNDLDKVVSLGWGPLKYINRFATLPLFNLLKQFNWNYGLVILALTIILKLVLSPLTYKSYL